LVVPPDHYNPVSIVKDEHGRKPQLLILETDGNTVNTDLDHRLQFVVQTDTNANLNVTGQKVEIISVGSGIDTSSGTAGHETIHNQ